MAQDVLALWQLSTDLRGERSEPVLSTAVALVHGGEVLTSAGRCKLTISRLAR